MPSGITEILSVLLLFTTASSLRAQTSAGASASASATIMSMLSLEAPATVVFSNIGVSTVQGGSLILSPGGGSTTTGGVTVSVNEGGEPLAFQLSGSGNYTYSMTLSDSVLVEELGTGGVTITNFTSAPSNTGQLGAGTGPVYLGATVNFPRAEGEGEITLDAELEVGINFN